MANKVCAFCGKSVGFFTRDALFCCNTSQPVCRDCYSQYLNVPDQERAEFLLRSGYPEDRETLRQNYETQRRWEEEARSARLSGLTCPRCGGAMLRRGRQTFKLGEETLFFSDLNRLASGSLELELLACEKCGKVEFYLPAGKREQA